LLLLLLLEPLLISGLDLSGSLRLARLRSASSLLSPCGAPAQGQC
jgi:hypothetical protein